MKTVLVKLIQETLRNINIEDIALASGVSVENIDNYLPYIGNYLVSTSISNSHDELNMEKTISLSNRIHKC